MQEETLRVGAVVIGRNEGERLKRCLRSLVDDVSVLVYVDSGSVDGSVAFAQSVGADVVKLDPSRPFTMARSRNAGLFRLLELVPQVEYVQFVDGDCEVLAGWIRHAQSVLTGRPEVAAAGGRLAERDRGASVYNRLCDLEWCTPIGEVRSCYGIAMMRVEALKSVGGFNETMIAGEEPELCARLRRAGWKILQLDAPMALHDAAMMCFSQWWRRAQRGGHAYAERAWIHGLRAQCHSVKALTSILFWGLGVPVLAIGSALTTYGLSLLLLLGYGVLWSRVLHAQQLRGWSAGDARLYATFTVLGKIPQTLGVTRFVWHRLVLRRVSGLIEYKLLMPSASDSAAVAPRSGVPGRED